MKWWNSADIVEFSSTLFTSLVFSFPVFNGGCAFWHNFIGVRIKRGGEVGIVDGHRVLIVKCLAYHYNYISTFGQQ